MPKMEGEPVAIRVIRSITAGQGRVTYVLTPEWLSVLLEASDAETAEDVSDEHLRDLCLNELDSVKAERELMSDSEGAQVDAQYSAYDSHFSSRDLGVDMMRRLFASPDGRMDQLCDPRYSPVLFDLRIVDSFADYPEVTAYEWTSIGHCVLQRMLLPPNLAE